MISINNDRGATAQKVLKVKRLGGGRTEGQVEPGTGRARRQPDR